MLHLDHYFESIRQFTHAIQVDPLEIRPYLCRAQAYNRVRIIYLCFKIYVTGYYDV